MHQSKKFNIPADFYIFALTFAMFYMLILLSEFFVWMLFLDEKKVEDVEYVFSYNYYIIFFIRFINLSLFLVTLHASLQVSILMLRLD